MNYFASFVYYLEGGARDFGNGVTSIGHSIKTEEDVRLLELKLKEEVDAKLQGEGLPKLKIRKLLILSFQEM